MSFAYSSFAAVLLIPRISRHWCSLLALDLVAHGLFAFAVALIAHDTAICRDAVAAAWHDALSHGCTVTINQRTPINPGIPQHIATSCFDIGSCSVITVASPAAPTPARNQGIFSNISIIGAPADIRVFRHHAPQVHILLLEPRGLGSEYSSIHPCFDTLSIFLLFSCFCPAICGIPPAGREPARLRESRKGDGITVQCPCSIRLIYLQG